MISSTAQLITFAFGLFAPVFLLATALPVPLRLVAMATYDIFCGANTDSLGGNVGAIFYSFTVLLVIAAFSRVAGYEKVEWRRKSKHPSTSKRLTLLEKGTPFGQMYY